MSATSGVAHQDGTRGIHFRVTGSGPPLLLIAGTGYPGATWPPEVVDSWATAFSVITYDHRGTGDSAGTDDEYTTRLFAGDAAQVVSAAASGPVAVIGHSMGGRVAQWLSLDRPDLVGRLVLVGSGAGRLRADHTAGGVPIRTVLLLTELGYEGYIRDLQRRTFFTAEFVADNPAPVRWLGDAFWAHRPSLEQYLKHVVARQSHDTSSILDRIEHRTLVVVGARDIHTGDTGSHVDQSRYLAERIPRATLETIPDVAHGPFWEMPDVTTRLIGDWLVAESERTGS
jgi:pimeloyl-ACP methyl ester carboxylesterase